MSIDVKPTAEVIDNMAKELIYKAEELKIVAAGMRKRNDLTYASEAIQVISNLMSSLRLDLLITRPLREMDKENK